MGENLLHDQPHLFFFCGRLLRWNVVLLLLFLLLLSFVVLSPLLLFSVFFFTSVVVRNIPKFFFCPIIQPFHSRRTYVPAVAPASSTRKRRAICLVKQHHFLDGFVLLPPLRNRFISDRPPFIRYQYLLHTVPFICILVYTSTYILYVFYMYEMCLLVRMQSFFCLNVWKKKAMPRAEHA